MMKARKNTTDRAATERDILNTAMPAFKEITGFCIKILEIKPAGKIQPDAVLQINAPDIEPKKFYAQMKGFITKATIVHVAEQIRRFEKPGMLVTRHVTPPMAERLKKLNLAFIDTAGNAKKQKGHVFILDRSEE